MTRQVTITWEDGSDIDISMDNINDKRLAATHCLDAAIAILIDNGYTRDQACKGILLVVAQGVSKES